MPEWKATKIEGGPRGSAEAAAFYEIVDKVARDDDDDLDNCDGAPQARAQEIARELMRVRAAVKQIAELTRANELGTASFAIGMLAGGMGIEL